MEKLPVIATVEGLGGIVEARTDFYNELKQLGANQAGLIFPRAEAYARLQTRGKENIGKEYGTWTTAGFEYVQGELPILRLDSILNNQELAKFAVEANRSGKYFCTKTQAEYEKSLKQAEKDKKKDPKDRSVIVLPSRDKFTMSDKNNWDVYEFALEDQAKAYFEFNGPITVYPVGKNVVDSQKGTLLTQMWFGNLGGRSGFDGDRVLNYDGAARGVRSVREAQQKISLPYTQKELSKHIQNLVRIELGDIKISDLESRVDEIVQFLKSLKQ